MPNYVRQSVPYDWNGHKAAISLTFDDGLPCHLSTAVPELRKRNMRGTFFVYPGAAWYDAGAWKKVASSGHEIGSHSLTHKKADELSLQEIEYEMAMSKAVLEADTGSEIRSYAHPHSSSTAASRDIARKYYETSRGSKDSNGGAFLISSGLEWHDVPARPAAMKVLRSVVDSAISARAWAIIIFHYIGPHKPNEPGGNFDRLGAGYFCAFLDALAVSDVWVAPYGEVAGLVKAHA